MTSSLNDLPDVLFDLLIAPDNYVEANLPPAIIKRLESGAFQSLCTHLRERSDQVSNIDLMTVSGFCRNCLSKWLVVEARKLSDSIQKQSGSDDNNENLENIDEIVQSLDAMGYDEAAQYVYGMMYPDWKKRHAQKASDDQMEKFNDSKALWATHDKQVLAKRREEKPAPPTMKTNNDDNDNDDKNIFCAIHRNKATTTTTTSLMSNVCCEDIDNIDNTKSANNTTVPSSKKPNTNSNNNLQRPGSFIVSPVLPAVSFSLGVLTVSDRAFSGGYITGDLSGPAVVEAIESILKQSSNNNNNNNNNNNVVMMERIETAIVPDDMDAIQKTLIGWSDDSNNSDDDNDNAVDLIVTTGGTGFSPRDVTPEATTAVLERPCDGLMSFCTLQCALSPQMVIQPLASLSRGTAGVRGRTLIVNLPGNPKAVQEILPILLPLALHAVADMKKMK